MHREVYTKAATTRQQHWCVFWLKDQYASTRESRKLTDQGVRHAVVTYVAADSALTGQ